MEKVKVFFRYIRPIRFNEARAELETQPYGGICFRFEPQDDRLLVSYAVCEKSWIFSKAIARRITEQRATDVMLADRMIIPYSTDLKVLTSSVLELCRACDANDLMIYHKEQRRSLGRALAELLAANEKEQTKAALWKEGLRAANFVTQYKKI